MQKQWPGCTYTAWRRTLPNGKSEYKSITISEDATAEEFMDFYLDDETRMKWDGMISETQLLESGGSPGDAGASRSQVVRWLRTFPFSFISQREYVIARRFFREADGSLYAVTKGLVEHPAAPTAEGGRLVRMEDFHSHWRSRTVPCPNGSGRPAVETTLLHFEDFKIPERLARFAVRHGMAGFVKGMIPAVQRFVAERRLRCDPHADDLASFGRRQLARAPLTAALETAGSIARTGSGLSSASCSSESGYSMDDTASERSASGISAAANRMSRSGSMRRLGAMMLASGVAIALASTATTSSLAAPPGAAGSGSGRHGSGKRHAGSSGAGSQQQSHQHGKHPHGHGHGHRNHGHSRHHDAPRPRRRQQAQHQEQHAAAGPEPAVMAAMVQA